MATLDVNHDEIVILIQSLLPIVVEMERNDPAPPEGRPEGRLLGKLVKVRESMLQKAANPPLQGPKPSDRTL